MVKNRMMDAQNENSLFSRSMSEIFSRKLRLSSNNPLFGHSADTVASYHEGEETVQSLEEMEAQTIGDLLPKDDYKAEPDNADHPKELDFFGMDLGDEGSSNHKIRKTPHRSGQKFIEFHDDRAAGSALQALNRSDIAGRQINLEPSRLESTRRLVQLPSDQDFAQFMQQSSLNYDATTGLTGSHPRLASTPGSINRNILAARAPINPLPERLPRALQSHLGVESFGNQFKLSESNQSQGHLVDIQGTPSFHARSLPEYNDDFADSSSPGNMIGTINPRRQIIDNRQQIHGVNLKGHADLNDGDNYRHHVTWGNSYRPQRPATMWQNSPSASFANNIGSPNPPQILHGVQRAPSRMLNPALPVNNHYVGSAPTMSPLWDRRQTYVGESPDASGVHLGSLGRRMTINTLHSVDFASHNISPPVIGNCLDFPLNNLGIQAHRQNSMVFPGRSQILPMVNPFDPSDGRDRSRRNENYSIQADKRQFELDIERIMRGEESRTTLMIKNIPNKYTSKMLLTAIDERHKGTFDFIYLPIDFKNKCNVGYAFINMTDPMHIIPLYQTFNGKKWEKFNSEKVASIAYARIQGKAALIAHFQNSSLMNEDKRCRPILFNTEGPNAGDQVPFPTGANIKSRRAKSRANTNECQQESHPIVANEEIPNFVKEDSSFSPAKQSD